MDIVSKLEEQIKQLTKELNETKEHLKKYTAPSRSKTFYKNHKEELL
jgi:regulator of replication initiation timing